MNPETKNPNYFYTKTAMEFINDWDHPVCILGGPMNLGKGAATIMKLFMYSFFKAPLVNGYRTSTFLAGRSDYAAFRETALPEIHKWFPPGSVTPAPGKESKMTTEININVPRTDTSEGVSCKIILISLKNFNPTDVESYNVTGMFWMETQEIDLFDTFRTIFNRTGRSPYRGMPKMFFGDINYPDELHWLYDRFVVDKDNTENKLQWKLHRIPPVIMLDDNGKYVENPDAEMPDNKRDYSYWWGIVHEGDEGYTRKKVIGDFAVIGKGKPVYPNFKDSMVVKTKPILGKALLFGVDPGNRANLAIVIGQLDLRGKLRILGCISPKAHMDFVTMTQELLMPYIMTEIYPYLCPDGTGTIKTYGWRDPSDAEDKHTNKNTGDMIKEYTGINTVKCGTNDINLRTSALQKRIRNDLIEIDESADDIIKGFKGGYYIDTNGKPDKGHYSHVMNALEYLCYGIDNHQGSIGEDEDEILMPVMN